ncbi:alpha/beta hydrolase [Roseiconus lacunae]|uniref:alpha/beta hydrolase n=1 Tax=Roseiconus lacunae TaxID=2605694 RepID=UPI0011F27F14|nr:alpha/beta hydrolase [Roseiconus lacunae]
MDSVRSSQRLKRYVGALISRKAGLIATIIVLVGVWTSWGIGSRLVAPARQVIGQPPIEFEASTIEFESDSGALIRGWHLRPANSQGIIVLLHGIRSSRRMMLDRARMLYEAGFASLLIDLQSHGESSGEAITFGARERFDATAAVRIAKQIHPGQPIGVIGVSLGGASAILASPLVVDAMVVESVYGDIRRAVHNRVEARLGPLSPLASSVLLYQLRYRLGIDPSELRPIDRIAKVGCPVMVISGSDDIHTTADETRALFAAANEPKSLWLVEGATHVDLYKAEPHEYRERVLEFLFRSMEKPAR